MSVTLIPNTFPEVPDQAVYAIGKKKYQWGKHDKINVIPIPDGRLRVVGEIESPIPR